MSKHRVIVSDGTKDFQLVQTDKRPNGIRIGYTPKQPDVIVHRFQKGMIVELKKTGEQGIITDIDDSSMFVSYLDWDSNDRITKKYMLREVVNTKSFEILFEPDFFENAQAQLTTKEEVEFQIVDKNDNHKPDLIVPNETSQKDYDIWVYLITMVAVLSVVAYFMF